MFPSYIDLRSLAEAAGATLPLQISDARAVQLVTAGNDRRGFRDGSRPPVPEWLLSAIAFSSSSAHTYIHRIANFLIGRVEPAILLCMILGKPFRAKAASASDNSYLSICSPFCNTQIPVVAESGGAQGEGGLSLLPSSLVDFVALIFFNLLLPMSDEPLLAGAALHSCCCQWHASG